MKNLLANGDSHTIGICTKPNDIESKTVEQPFAKQIAKRFGLHYTNLAWPGGSNNRIIRTTVEALLDLDPAQTVILIGWSNWNRTEWYWDNQWHDICGDPGYNIPDFAKVRWQQTESHVQNQWTDPVAEHDQWTKSKENEHAIWVFHHLLNNLGYKFLFFLANYCSKFKWDTIQNNTTKLPWLSNTWAHDPYEDTGFSDYCLSRGHQADVWWHFDQAAHDNYANYLEPYIKLKLL
jgi:hypothetical protein